MAARLALPCGVVAGITRLDEIRLRGKLEILVAVGADILAQRDWDRRDSGRRGRLPLSTGGRSERL